MGARAEGTDPGILLRLTLLNDDERIAARLGDTELWVTGRDRHGELVRGSSASPAFLPLAMIIAAEAGEALHVEGEVTDDTIVRLNLDFAPMMREYFALPVTPRLIADAIVPTSKLVPSSATGLMFSAGVDSFYSLHRLEQEKVPPTHLVNLHAGAASDNPAAWRRRIENIGHVADALGMGMLAIETNLHRALLGKHEKSHTIRNVCGLLAFDNVIGGAYYSASNHFQHISFATSVSRGLISFIEPVLIRALVPAGYRIAILGQDAARIEKTRAIGTNDLVRRHLDVCLKARYQGQPDNLKINCGRCLKCVRTLFTLESLGLLEGFEEVFDLQAWNAEREPRLQWLERKGAAGARADLVQLGRTAPRPTKRQRAAAEAHPEIAKLRAEIRTIKRSRTYRTSRLLAKAYRLLRGRPAAKP